MSIIHFILLSFLGMFFLCSATADERGERIIRKAQDNTRAPHERKLLDIELLKAGVVTNKRKMRYLFLLDGEVEKTLVKFTQPASIKNTALLLHDRGTGENKIWSYSPTNRRIRRISGALRRNYFMGTEFTYEDFEGYRIGSRRYQFIQEIDCASMAGCFVVDGFETEKTILANTGYTKRRYILDKKTYYPIQIDFFNRAGEKCKTLTATGIKKIGQYYTPSVQHMNNIREGRGTKFILLEVDNKTPRNAGEVSQLALRREN
uniref:Outer membrane lipoprotein-sorting protein n=1 Tax=Candidatus Kentrum sp. DK TaxID=2126562 RepID=A0A450TF18_9GAMM|nr:MAG: outer membrane lipoprotein-sorting protein [Candidatus Kentron sp. DK]VFJ65673.1 MAG: outer membrane lipoprotein-sorting protein [Candidatus Kentron sp. DK]